jgi:hypothetical protein
MDRAAQEDRAYDAATRPPPAATIVLRSIFVSAIALVVLSAALDNSHAQTPDVGVQGPWAYTRQADRATEAVQDMAATTAIEDNDVWLLLACSDDRQMTISVMHIEEFSYPVMKRVNVSLRIDSHPSLGMPAVTVNSQQISIDPATSHDLLPLLLHGNQSSVRIPDSRGNTHDYSFILQPNDLALGNIRERCLNQPNR